MVPNCPLLHCPLPQIQRSHRGRSGATGTLPKLGWNRGPASIFTYHTTPCSIRLFVTLIGENNRTLTLTLSLTLILTLTLTLTLFVTLNVTLKLSVNVNLSLTYLV